MAKETTTKEIREKEIEKKTDKERHISIYSEKGLVSISSKFEADSLDDLVKHAERIIDRLKKKEQTYVH